MQNKWILTLNLFLWMGTWIISGFGEGIVPVFIPAVGTAVASIAFRILAPEGPKNPKRHK
jgi:hypothetical protein